MLKFMACSQLFAYVLAGHGLAWPALLLVGLYFVTPFAALAWYALGPGTTLSD